MTEAESHSTTTKGTLSFASCEIMYFQVHNEHVTVTSKLWSYFCFPHSLHAKFVKYKFIIINNTKNIYIQGKTFLLFKYNLAVMHVNAITNSLRTGDML